MNNQQVQPISTNSFEIATRGSDVIVCSNRLSIVVALQYDAKLRNAPKVMFKAEGSEALEIFEWALINDISIIENDRLVVRELKGARPG